MHVISIGVSGVEIRLRVVLMLSNFDPSNTVLKLHQSYKKHGIEIKLNTLQDKGN